MHKLYSKGDIIKIITEEYGEGKICLIDTTEWDLTNTPKRRNRDAGRSKFADEATEMIFGIKRETIIRKNPRCYSTGEYNFSYIKFAKNNAGEVFGIVNGLSCFHCYYPSDIYFYPIPDKNNSKVSRFMEENKLEWYTATVLILKNENPKDRKEAVNNEKWLHRRFNLMD